MKPTSSLSLDIPTLQSHATNVRSILGSEFIQEIEQSDSHPFSSLWESLETAIRLNIKEPSAGVSISTVYCMQISNAFCTLDHLENFPRLISAFKVDTSYYSAVFELFTAASLRAHGHDLEIVPESPTSSKPDFYIQYEGNRVSIECKCLEDLANSESRKWEHFSKTICAAMLRAQRSWIVEINSNYRVDGKGLNQLLSSITNDIDNDNIQHVEFSPHLSYKIEKLSIWGEPSLDITKIYGRGELGTAFSSRKKDENGENIFSKSRVVTVNPLHTTLHWQKKIIRTFKKAIRQIPNNEHGVIHIGLPFRKGTDFLEVVDTIFDKLFSRLND